MAEIENILRLWSKRPSDSEQERIERTERMIRAAIAKSEDPKVNSAKIFAKGSVRMNTNIRSASDIDICVQSADVFFTNYPTGKDHADFNNVSSDYSFNTFRRGVENALTDYFGTTGVDTSGNKAIHINNTTQGSRIDADVVPAFEHRRYNADGSYFSGIEIRSKSDINAKTINWPHHNYNNNLSKHNNTSHRYRKMVRIFKRVREAMANSELDYNHDAQSFLIESLLWNVPDEYFGFDNYLDDIVNIITYLKENLTLSNLVDEWGEVNELKYLFKGPQKWTREGALVFINNSNQYLGELNG